MPERLLAWVLGLLVLLALPRLALADPGFTRTGQWVANLGRRIDIDPATGVAVAEQILVQRPVAFPA